jgi:cation transport protein ChaC
MLTRDAIKNGLIDRIIEARGGLPERWTHEQIAACVRDTVAAGPRRGDLWVFGYGSLMWNPAIHFEERRRARLFGYHRRFCLWTSLGRGSAECPGLLLGLEPGGSCAGVALRVARAAAEAELDILFRREMVSGAYVPRWCSAEIDGVSGRVPALVFAMNRLHARYARRLPRQQIVEAIASARGPLGACHDYLEQTVAALDALGIRDRYLEDIQRDLATRAGAAKAAGRQEAPG